MLIKDKKKRLLFLDIIEVGLSLCMVVMFTLLFRFINNDIRYLFLVLAFFMIFVFSKVLASLENDLLVRVVKNSNTLVNSKYIRKISI